MRRHRRSRWRAATLAPAVLAVAAVVPLALAPTFSLDVRLYAVLYSCLLLALAVLVLVLDARIPNTVTADPRGVVVRYLRSTRTEAWAGVLRVRDSGLGGEDEYLELVDGRLVGLPPGLPSGTVGSWRTQLDAPSASVASGTPPVWRIPPKQGAPLVLLLNLPATVYLVSGTMLDHSVPALLLSVAVVTATTAWALRLQASGAEVRADPTGVTFAGPRRRRETVTWQDLARVRDLHRFDRTQVLERTEGTTVTLPPGLTRDVVLGWQSQLAADQPVGAGLAREGGRRHRAPRRRWPGVMGGLLALLGIGLVYLAVTDADGARQGYFVVLSLLLVVGTGAWFLWWLTHEPREVTATSDGLAVRYRWSERSLPWQQVRRVRGSSGFEGRDLHVELVSDDLVQLPAGLAAGTVERWRTELGGAASDVPRGAPQVWRVPFDQSTPAVWGWLLPQAVYQVSGPLLGFSVPALLGGVLLVLLVVAVRRRTPEATFATTEGLSFRRGWRTETVRWSDFAGVDVKDRWDDTPVVRRTDGSHVQLRGGLTKDVVEQWHEELAHGSG